MPSTYNELGIELMVTGENAGTWGDNTNTNLNIIQQAVAGYAAVAITDGSTKALAITDGATTTSDARNMIIKLTGTMTGNSIVTVPDSVEKIYLVHNTVDHAGNTLTFKTASGTGVLLCEGNSYTLYSDGTNIAKLDETRVWRAITAAETVQAGANIAANTNGAPVTITLPASPSLGDTVNFIDQGWDFNSNALTVGRNSSNIANASSDLVVNTQGAAFGLVYSGDATTGWTYTEK
jgi:hypothetical protein|tara:strand:- start:111 stop:818 length:708 start_codon:yes stop_codon:yes gene_type:complete